MKIKIGEKNYKLNYNNAALFKIEKELDKPVFKVFQDSNELEKLHTVFTIVWAGLEDEISFSEFSSKANFNDLAEALPKIIEAIGEGFETGSKKK